MKLDTQLLIDTKFADMTVPEFLELFTKHLEWGYSGGRIVTKQITETACLALNETGACYVLATDSDQDDLDVDVVFLRSFDTPRQALEAGAWMVRAFAWD